MKIRKDTVIKILNTIYDNAVVGLPGTLSIEEEVQKEQLRKKGLGEPDQEKKCHCAHIDSVIKWAVAKSACSGFVSSVGGIITLPVTVPAGLTASLYIQLRMIAKIAYICGYDIKSEEVKTFIYCCLTGDAVKEILKSAGIKVGQKLTQKMIASISGKILIKINKLVGFRLFTKFGSKGIINLSKMVPIASGIFGACIDGYWCRVSGKTAKKWLYQKPHDNEHTYSK